MENYQKTIDYLYSLEYSGIKLGLEKVSHLLQFLGNPQKKWPAVHIAGTNGKGSTAAFIYTILKEAGYKVGLYSSPHLVDFSERIRINEQKISWESMVEYTRNLKDQIEKHQATFFEATTAMAFAYFADQKVDIAVIETGLGGRLDATNLVEPLATVITSISADHQQFLGDTLPEISYEKAGIMKSGVPCFTIQQFPEVMQVLQEKATEKNVPFFVIQPASHFRIREEDLKGSNFDLFLPPGSFQNLRIPLAGTHQISNAALAVAAIQVLRSFPCSEQQIRGGLLNTSWPGRFQHLADNPLTILDVAHNPDGFEKVLSFIKEKAPGKNIRTICGLSKDKDYRKIADILSHYVTKVGVVSGFSSRSLDPEILSQELVRRAIPTEIFEDINTAYSVFRETTPATELLLIIGSHYLAGEFLKKIQIS
jgi:dihydrofolate synthase/folylpolyglutamate synthase